MAFQLIKNDPEDNNLTNVAQFAILNDVAKKIGSTMSKKVYHFETSHGHILDFTLDKHHRSHNNPANLVGFAYLAKLETNPWVRHVSISNERLCVHLKRSL